MNQTILIGRITKDLELRTTTNGIAVSQFTIAVNREVKNANGNYDTDFINCIAFRKQAELLCKYCKKGDLTCVKGRIQTRSYDGQDGTKKYITEVIADKITFLSTKPKEEVSQTDIIQSALNEEDNHFNLDEIILTDDLPF